MILMVVTVPPGVLHVNGRKEMAKAMKEIITVQQRNGKRYAGIGARKTPKHIQQMMMEIGTMYGALGYMLHSGAASGADTAFETGHKLIAPKNMEIFLPSDGFNKRSITESCVQGGVCMEAMLIGKKYYVPPSEASHMVWNKLKLHTKKLYARNGYQVLGRDLNTPVNFVLCWTPGAGYVGGTRQALYIADDYGIPIYNLANQNVYDGYKKALTKYRNKCSEVIRKSKI